MARLLFRNVPHLIEMALGVKRGFLGLVELRESDHFRYVSQGLGML